MIRAHPGIYDLIYLIDFMNNTFIQKYIFHKCICCLYNTQHVSHQYKLTN